MIIIKTCKIKKNDITIKTILYCNTDRVMVLNQKQVDTKYSTDLTDDDINKNIYLTTTTTIS